MKFVYEGDKNGNGLPDVDEIEITPLDGDGDFRSEECVELLKEADVVITNPPFSLFREYIAQLVEYQKKFLILGSINAIKYKEVFPLIRRNKVWLGVFSCSTGMSFRVPPDSEPRATRYWIDETGQKWRSIGNVSWFTNMNHKKRNQTLDLVELYDPDKYPKYDNYDAIDVSKVANIPEDYAGVMGVPITFLDKYCPRQFQVLGISEESVSDGAGNLWRRGVKHPLISGKKKYCRLFIRNLDPITGEE
mgnify:CR=1 FL=1